MAKIQLLAGSTSNTINVFVQDSSSTVGAGLSGLAYNTSGLTAYYALPKATPVAITLATQTATGAFSSGGFVELDATHCKGLYRLDIPDAAVAAGRFANIYLYGATNMAPVVLEIELTATNNQSATAFITGINSLAPPTNWNLLSIDGSGLVNIIQAAADKVWSTAARILTAGTNIVLAKGTGLTGLNDIAATAVVSNGAITTSAGKVSEVALTDTLTTYTGNTQQTADVATLIATVGAAGVGLTAIPDEAGVTTLLARLTALRAGYLDNLSGGAVALASAVAALNNLSSAQAQTACAAALAAFAAAQPSESYAANTVVPTRDQFLFMIFALLNSFSNSGTTETVKKLDNTTAAMTYTYDDATTPTSHTRAT